MAWSLGSYTAGENAAYQNDRPLIIGHNRLKDATNLIWTSGGTNGEADITSGTAYAYRAHDGRGTVWTRAEGTLSTVYLNAQFPAATIDAICIIFAQAFDAAEVTVQLSDDGTFDVPGGDNVVNFAGPFSSDTGKPRIARTWGGSRYTGVEYLRIRFVKDSGSWTTSTLPRISEIFIGQARPISQGFAFGSDDRAPDVGDAREFESRSGDVTTYRRFDGRYVATHRNALSENSIAFEDDVAAVRALARESLSFQRKILFWPQPNTRPDVALLGKANDIGLRMPQPDFDVFEFAFDFREVPFFRLKED